MKPYGTFLVIGGILTACATHDPTSATSLTSTTQTTGASVRAPENPTTAGVTAMDQGTDQVDLTTTRDLRQAVVADDQLSLSAKDVTIIANAGVITLRGKVQSADEKRIIEAKVKEYADNYLLDDQLEIEAEK